MTLNTRVYFEDDELKNDPLLSIISLDNVNSLIAKKIKKSSYLFDIFLQGDKETIFLDI
jgi:protocatechuate 3,4-dioxygenase alpha subunit